ncbi:MAG: substrate-binding domain-containing protein [Planctomycetota bacterium]
MPIKLLLLCALLAACRRDPASTEFITLASTTSPENSGLFAVLLPKFTERTGIEVRALPVGTGKALRTARDGNADLVFVHAEALEKRFVAEGHGLARIAVMMNEFVVVGPPDDPAGVAGLRDAAEALRRIARTRSTFVSRGDDSGTHVRERSTWTRAGVDPTPHSGDWYLEAGAGMGATLNVAVSKGAYCITDSSTWGAFANKGDLTVHVEGDPPMRNPYTLIVVSKAKHPHAKQEQAQRFADWITSSEGQAIIGAFEVNGARLFVPNAPP